MIGKNLGNAASKAVTVALKLSLSFLLLGSELVQAQPKQPTRDYGSEIIEPVFATANKPIPVELAEEQGKPVDIASIEKQKTAAHPITSDLDEEADRELDKDTTALLNAKDVDIATLVKTFSKLTGRNYIVDSSVKGSITIHLPSAVTLAEAMRIFDSVLLLKGFTTVPIGDNIWKVVSARDAQQTTIPVVSDSPENPSDKIVTQLVRLKYIQASDMQQLLSKFVSKEGSINSFSGTNSLIVIDSQANIARLRRLIEQLDIPARDQDITIIPIQYATAKDVAEKVNEILGEKEKDESPNRASSILARRRLEQTGAATNPRSGATAGGNVEGSRTLPLKIIADERTNSLIVIADDELTAKVRALVEQLDSKVDLSGGRFYVYRLKHADAEVLSDILSKLISGAESTKSSPTTQGSSLSRKGQTKESSPASSIGERVAEALRRRQSSTAAAMGSGSGESSGKVNLEGEVSIAPDPSTNSLIINASRNDYLKIKEVIDELDVKRRQVIVEATILEVSLSKDEGMGIELQGTAATDEAGVFGQTNWGGLTNLITNPAALSDLTIAAASAGTITLPGGIVLPSQALLISAVSRNSNVNVLSSPTILTTDNEEAEIIVGENVPFVSSTSTDPSNLNNTFNQVERQDVGITLRITPQISLGDFVTLKIFAEISNVVPGTRNDPNGPTTTIRTTETTVEVSDGQMIVTGGLISDNVTESVRGVPFLQDIPVIGEYFKRNDENSRRTNLLVFLTPKIIADQYDAREQTVERRDSLQGVLDKQENGPDRSEILQSKSIDRVTETTPQDFGDRTVITPPTANTNDELARSTYPNGDGAAARTRERLNALMGQTPKPVTLDKSAEPIEKIEKAPTLSGDSPADTASGDVIDVRVKPRLPIAAPATEHGEMRSSLALPTTFVVLREMTKSGSAKTLALRVAGDGKSAGARFFDTGGQYRFRDGKKESKYICLGKYASAEEAATIDPDLVGEDAWRDLSPRDVLALGKGPWSRG